MFLKKMKNLCTLTILLIAVAILGTSNVAANEMAYKNTVQPIVTAEKSIQISLEGTVPPSITSTGLYVRYSDEVVDPLQGSLQFFPDLLYETEGYINFSTIGAFKVYATQIIDDSPIPFNYQITQYDLAVNGTQVPSVDIPTYMKLFIDNNEHFDKGDTVFTHADANSNLEIYPEFQFLGVTPPVSPGDHISLAVNLLITPVHAI